jgi:YesN/AraC family two-component response regulator
MDTLAYKFYTNRSYLSNYINVYKQKTFREWINCLRVEEAKKLLREYPEKTIAEIAAEVGIPDTTCFRRHFVSLTGLSPKIWRNNNDD